MADTSFFEDLAKRLDLEVTGGSDYHGTVKAKIRLGTGHEGNLNIPRSVLDKLREAASPDLLRLLRRCFREKRT